MRIDLYKYHHSNFIFHRFQVNVFPQSTHLLMNPINLLTLWNVKNTLRFAKRAVLFKIVFVWFRLGYVRLR